MDATINPTGSLEVLSRQEVTQLLDAGQSGLYELWRKCSLAVLNAGEEQDDPLAVLGAHPDFEIDLLQQERGVKLSVTDAPDHAFVDGSMIQGIRELLFSVLRDLIYTRNEVLDPDRFDLSNSAGITNAVFHILRNAGVLRSDRSPDMVVCWGGHAIGREEYDYSKRVGYELGLRGLQVCTGCGSGAMKGPMKGATIGHQKQRRRDGRYVGITEPSIIAAEAPNAIVNELIIMPDMEKRLEAFVRLGHGIVVFPGGVGTAEEILYLLGLLQHADNAELPLPVVFSGPKSARAYFEQMDEFIALTLGPSARKRYRIVIDDPSLTAKEIAKGIEQARRYRNQNHDAYYFNWLVNIPEPFQRPFEATHETMAALELHRDQSAFDLAMNLRRAFSGIVAGNVREDGIRRVREHGPFELRGDPVITNALANLLAAFVNQKRMKLHADYEPCYRVVG